MRISSQPCSSVSDSFAAVGPACYSLYRVRALVQLLALLLSESDVTNDLDVTASATLSICCSQVSPAYWCVVGSEYQSMYDFLPRTISDLPACEAVSHFFRSSPACGACPQPK